MGYISVMGHCYSCRVLMTFSPTKVPSIIIDGHAEPVCRACIEGVNPTRIANGLEPFTILPGAYEPDNEDLP